MIALGLPNSKLVLFRKERGGALEVVGGNECHLERDVAFD